MFANTVGWTSVFLNIQYEAGSLYNTTYTNHSLINQAGSLYLDNRGLQPSVKTHTTGCLEGSTLRTSHKYRLRLFPMCLLTNR